MELSKYLLESMQVNEADTSKRSITSVGKFLKKENLDMSDNGFGGFGEDAPSMFAMFYKEVIMDLLVDINFDEFKTLNSGFGTKVIKSLDDKKQRFMDKGMMPKVGDVVSKIAELCKWDADVCAKALNTFFKSQKVDLRMKTENVQESVNESKEAKIVVSKRKDSGSFYYKIEVTQSNGKKKELSDDFDNEVKAISFAKGIIDKNPKAYPKGQKHFGGVIKGYMESVENDIFLLETYDVNETKDETKFWTTIKNWMDVNFKNYDTETVKDFNKIVKHIESTFKGIPSKYSNQLAQDYHNFRLGQTDDVIGAWKNTMKPFRKKK